MSDFKGEESELDSLFKEGNYILNNARKLMRGNADMWVFKEFISEMEGFIAELDEFRKGNHELSQEDVYYIEILTRQILDKKIQLSEYVDYIENRVYNRVKNLPSPVVMTEEVRDLRKLAYYRMNYSDRLIDKLGLNPVRGL